jgi:hypothetical protein
MYNRQTQWSLDFSPFEPVIKQLIFIQKEPFCRGACDDKANVHARKSIRIHDPKQYFALQREIYD